MSYSLLESSTFSSFWLKYKATTRLKKISVFWKKLIFSDPWVHRTVLDQSSILRNKLDIYPRHHNFTLRARTSTQTNNLRYTRPTTSWIFTCLYVLWVKSSVIRLTFPDCTLSKDCKVIFWDFQLFSGIWRCQSQERNRYRDGQRKEACKHHPRHACFKCYWDGKKGQIPQRLKRISIYLKERISKACFPFLCGKPMWFLFLIVPAFL